MRSKILGGCTIALSLLCAALPALAHHGTAAYDLKNSLTLNGTITSLEWTNPHTLLHFDAKDDKGEMQHWSIEMYNTLWMTRAGWSKTAVKAGDPVEITFHAAKNGTPNGYVRDGDGKVTIAGKGYGFHQEGDERATGER